MKIEPVWWAVVLSLIIGGLVTLATLGGTHLRDKYGAKAQVVESPEAAAELTSIVSKPVGDDDLLSDGEGEDEGSAEVEGPFVPLLIVSALSVAFAHGGNDVGNAVGPLSVIIGIIDTGVVEDTVHVPMWALFMGAAGFCFGIVTMGSRTITTVGNKITKLTPSRSYATQIGAAVAVLSSSVAGLPVSTSHCLVGAVIGVGLAQKLTGTDSPLQLNVLKKIVIGWMVTIPLAMFAAVVIYYPFQQLFR